jgi:hypothetical protein
VLATGNHFLLDILAGLATLALAVLFARLAATASEASMTRLRRAASRFAQRRRDSSLPESRPAAAYRMSQSCYEVRERID